MLIKYDLWHLFSLHNNPAWHTGVARSPDKYDTSQSIASSFVMPSAGTLLIRIEKNNISAVPQPCFIIYSSIQVGAVYVCLTLRRHNLDARRVCLHQSSLCVPHHQGEAKCLSKWSPIYYCAFSI